ncbi:MAG: dTMP kinase [Ktedonobacteraceae bacterium]
MAQQQHLVRNSSQGETPRIAPERPRLIVLEGIDLSGRTTQVQLLHDWLLAQRYLVTTAAWRSSPLISDILAQARTGPPLKALTYSLLFSADHIDRTQCVIKPAIARGEIVLADRYTYTAFARDAARGLDTAWVHNLYRYSVQPDVVFYLHISPEEAVKRRLSLQQQRLDTVQKHGKHEKHGKASNKKATKDIKGQKETPVLQPQLLTREALESFRNFEMKMYSEYQQMQQQYSFTVIEGDQSIDHVQTILRRAVMHLLLEV